MSQWEVVIGLETHAQLQTKSKIFSGSSIAFGAEPNVQANAVDIALPGVLPVLNREAVVCAIKFGLAVGATIAPRSVFARKNYFYPDLPKGYQISQFEIPVVQGGGLAIRVGEQEKFVRLTRAHLEEDAGKSLHEDFHGRTGIDLNRAGTPLLEIVTEPDMRSSAEAVAYARALHALVQWIGICDGNMQEGSFRCDANVSVRRPGEPLGTRREIKNLNSFRFMQQAIDFEVQWQINEISEGRAIRQATVLFDPDTAKPAPCAARKTRTTTATSPIPTCCRWKSAPTGSPRSNPACRNCRRPCRRASRRSTGSRPTMRRSLTASRGMADYFVTAVAAAGAANAKTVANWIMGELAARLNKNDMDVDRGLTDLGAQLAGLVQRIADNTISNNIAKKVFEALWNGEGPKAPTKSSRSRA
jgi:aspartyl-tRNA(Asn)/glutamyl-tRNA(Gln) amidotransferase subunit B